jgi:hypothetical protein
MALMAQYVAIAASALQNFLESRKFVQSFCGREIVYIRRSSRNPDVCIKVYTSIKVGERTVRASGRDSIKVCCVFDNGRRSFGIGKFPPVLRVDSEASILARLDARIRAAAARATEWMDSNGTPSLRAQSQADVDADEAYMNRIVADAERAAEVRAFSSDPDYRDFLKDVELEEIRGAVPPEWLCDPCSEPPPPNEV